MTRHLLKFAGVGLVCLCLQLALLYVLDDYWPPLLANGVGFVISAQCNFVLSYTITWSDSVRKSGKQLFHTWLRFMTNVVIGLGTNSALFGLVHDIGGVPSPVAAIAATAFSTACTFLINDKLVFPQRGVS